MRLYTWGLISEEGVGVLLDDLENQADNLRLLMGDAESDLSLNQENIVAAQTTEAWLIALGEKIAEVQRGTEEAYLPHRELAALLVDKNCRGPRRVRPGEGAHHLSVRSSDRRR